MKRRSFLQILGISPVAAPVAAREAARVLAEAPVHLPPLPSAPNLIAETAKAVFVSPEMKAARETLQWLQRRRRWEARDIRSVDPSIAAMKSWSPAYQLIAQRQLMNDLESLIERLRLIAWPGDQGMGIAGDVPPTTDAQSRW
jgi:hypothetical protein